MMDSLGKGITLPIVHQHREPYMRSTQRNIDHLSAIKHFLKRCQVGACGLQPFPTCPVSDHTWNKCQHVVRYSIQFTPLVFSNFITHTCHTYISADSEALSRTVVGQFIQDNVAKRCQLSAHSKLRLETLSSNCSFRIT